MIHEKPLNKGPFVRDLSHYFFDSVKYGDFLEVRNCLTLDPMLVLDYDNIGMTGLHWAAKKGFDGIVELLLDANANVEAEDMLKRTPEFFVRIG